MTGSSPRSRLVREALRVDGSLPTTTAGVEAGMVTMLLAIRGAVLLQLAVALPSILGHSQEPRLSLLLVILVYGWAAYFAVHVLRRGSLRVSWLITVDVTLACVLLILQCSTIASGAEFLTWDGWGFGVTLNTAALAALGLRTKVATSVSAALLATCYLTPLLTAPFTAAQRTSAMTNALAYFAFAFAARVAAGYLRRLGAASDDARAEAARMAQEAEMERTRTLLHDQSSVLSMLSRRGDADDPSFVEVVRKAARQQAARVDSFMAGRDRLGGNATTLADGLLAVSAEFPDLPVTCSVDLAREVRLTPETLAAVCSAVRTVLDNVRRHSSASNCVVHADSPSDSTWEVIVTDDGVGFDTDLTPHGYGLSRLVHRAMESVGAQAQIASRPGEGTVITINGQK